ncbi:MAG TPA: Tfp pilus assembly protein PilF [Ktedonobacter sp.]|jgi:tetratricopeptide (TPR) repeat protein|nr:Tfp pilus assembly protein PilF [Ktedonobacter sp.]HCP75741.1 Tfp pilus assembly protein PilF [Ktedonobacter sp.]
MALLSIQERSGGSESSNAVVSFDNGPLYPITISNPFSDEEEQELEWYFEEHLEFPFTNKVRAQNAARSITTYGENLFKQVFGDNDVYAEYRALLIGGLSGLQIEIEGSPTFHALHWEAIKDPRFEQPLALQAVMIRKNLHPQALPASARPSPTINLLIVTARPSVERDVGYRTISRPLVESLRNANLAVQVDILRPGTYKALENHLRVTTEQHGEGYYHVIHFDVHGAVLAYEQYESIQPRGVGNSHLYKQYGRNPIQPYEGVKAFLSFEPDANDEDTKKKTDLVEATQLAALLVEHHVPVIILNACQSGKQVGERETSLGSHLVQSGVQLVLAMGYSVTVSAAELLMRTLYQRLFAGDDLTVAIRHARTELANDEERLAYFDQKIELEDWLLPVVYQNRPVTLQPREFTLDERKDWFERKAEQQRYTPPDPTYGFVGRDLDILRIEKHLLTRRNILLVRGMGGAGKTTLLRHLAAWWHTTGFVRRVFSFGYDEKAWTLQQIMTDIAQSLYGPKYYTDFQPLSPAAQQAMLAGRLRSENHLLLLDNLESITGAHLAMGHTLPQTEQKALHSFLADLAKGRTLVLLGSRGSEDWLSKGTFDDNIYELPGLDKQAASTLADRILLKNNAEQYRQHPDLKQMLKLLNGFPLALEVVLANLAHQTPNQVLAALETGDVRLDVDESQQDKNIFEQKTESILRCIDYSHSNLSPEAQFLLLCLAPFTSVIVLGIFDQYTFYLKRQPALATLPIERWVEVVGVAENWGLLRRDPNNPEFVHLQPTLPYFLRSRLTTLQQTEVRRAIETAYCEHYAQYGSILYDLLQSKNPQDRHKGRVLTQLEYENLTTALKLALAAQTRIIEPYTALDGYLDVIYDSQRGLELGQMVLERLQDYPAEQRTDFWKFEVSIVIDSMARHKLQLKDYEASEALYHRALSIYVEEMNADTDDVKKMIADNYHQLGIVAEIQRLWTQAEEYFRKSLQIRIECNDPHAQADSYYQLGVLAQRQHHWLQSGEYYQQALQMYKESGDRYAEADTHYQLSTVAGEGHRWDQVEEHCKRSLQIYGEFNDHYAQAKVFQELGDAAREQHHLTQARDYFQQALQLKINFNDSYSQAGTYFQLGIVAQQQGEWLQAEQYYQQALDIFTEYNDLDDQADAYHQLARLAQEQSQWNQAEQYYQQALNIYVELNDRYKQAKTYLNLGSLAQGQQKWIHAEGYYQQALPIFTEFNDRYGESVTYANLGAVAQEQKQWDLAEHYNRQALPILIELNDHYGQANVYSNLGWIAHEQQQLDQARDYFLQALEIFTAYEAVEAASPALFGLALLWQSSCDPNMLSDIASIFEISIEEVKGLLNFIVTNNPNK